MNIAVRSNQVMIDMPLQGAGDVELLIAVALLNGKSITDDIHAGEIITTPDAVINKRKTAAFFNSNPNYPASGNGNINISDLFDDAGVGYDIVDDDLIVYEN